MKKVWSVVSMNEYDLMQILDLLILDYSEVVVGGVISLIIIIIISSTELSGCWDCWALEEVLNTSCLEHVIECSI